MDLERARQSSLKDTALRIFTGVLDVCDPEIAVCRALGAQSGGFRVGGDMVSFDGFDEIRVAAVGKAADAMMRAAARGLQEAGWGDRPKRGLVVSHAASALESPAWAVRLVGGHPIPDERSFEAGERLLAFFDGCTPRTLALFLLSGGGSALVEVPLDPRLTVRDLAEFNDLLVRSTLPIRSINAIRKHLSALKGGRLAMRAAAAEQITLLVSDVAPGDMQSVASGPTLPDETTVDDVAEAVGRLGSRERLSEAIRLALAPGALAETPKSAEFRSIHSRAVTVLDATHAARAAVGLASRYAARVELIEQGDGPLESVVDGHLRALEALLRRAGGDGVCAVVSTGEVTLDVTGRGLGGRNQHSALHALTRVRDLCPSACEYALLSGGTDGRDGPTDAAGAVVSPGTFEAAEALELDPRPFLANHDSHRFLKSTGALIVTGATGTNVRDVRVFLARGR